MLTNLE